MGGGVITWGDRADFATSNTLMRIRRRAVTALSFWPQTAGSITMSLIVTRAGVVKIIYDILGNWDGGSNRRMAQNYGGGKKTRNARLIRIFQL